MQLLIFLSSWIFIALGVAIDNLDINLYNDPFVDPTLDPGVHDTDLFEDASESDLSLFTDSSNNQWDSLPHSDTALSSIDGMDWESDSLVDNNQGGSNPLFDTQTDISDSFWLDEGVFVFFFLSFPPLFFPSFFFF